MRLCVCYYADSNSVLADYEYVQQCLNLDRDICFVIVDVDSVSKPFRREVRYSVGRPSVVDWGVVCLLAATVGPIAR